MAFERDGEDAVTLDYTDDAATFGDRLVLARECTGMVQAELARRMGVRVHTLRSWEEDQAEPRANRLQMLAGVLGVSMVWLMAGKGAPPQPAAVPPLADAAGEACLADLHRLRAEQLRIAERLGQIERRLRAVLS